MARIRSVHPGLWTDEEFVQMSLHARLFLIGLWNEADDCGLFEWKPIRLKMRIAPADAVDPDNLLNEIEIHGFVVSLERDGRKYGAVRNFRKYQRPKNPSSPIITLDDDIRGIVGLPLEGTPTPALPQPYPSPTENHPQMEDGGDKREEKSSRRDAEASSGGEPEGGKVVGLEALIFKQGRTVFGERHGGSYVTRLRKHFDGDWLKVKAAIDRAAETADQKAARAYAEGILRKPRDDDWDPLNPTYSHDEIFPEEIYRGVL